MAGSKVEEFLDLYKQLEMLVTAKYNNDSGQFESVMIRYENSREIGNLKNELGTIRKIRNLLQHNPKIKGSYVVEPSDSVLETLRTLVQQVKNPPLAIEFGIRAEKIYKTYLDSPLLKTIEIMQNRGYSHVPVISRGKFFGVLSAYTVFEFFSEDMEELNEKTPVSIMRDLLPIDKHKNEYYLFMPRTATFTEADQAFEKRDSKGRRLTGIFITEHGSQDEPILSMLTPWSVVGK